MFNLCVLKTFPQTLNGLNIISAYVNNLTMAFYEAQKQALPEKKKSCLVL